VGRALADHRIDRTRQVDRRLEALVGPLRERACDDLIERAHLIAGRRRGTVAHARRRGLAMHAQDVERLVGDERLVARQHLEQQDPARIDVRAGVDGAPDDLLGRHV
jgi:hypothetical protein